ARAHGALGPDLGERLRVLKLPVAVQQQPAQHQGRDQGHGGEGPGQPRGTPRPGAGSPLLPPAVAPGALLLVGGAEGEGRGGGGAGAGAPTRSRTAARRSLDGGSAVSRARRAAASMARRWMPTVSGTRVSSRSRSRSPASARARASSALSARVSGSGGPPKGTRASST